MSLTAEQPTPFQLERDFAGGQRLGSREEQQDAYAFSLIDAGDKDAAAGSLFVVLADGMGGHRGGREASRAAVQGAVDGLFSHLREDGSPSANASEPAWLTPGCMALVMAAANRAVDGAIRREPGEMEGAGTTFLALAVTRKRMIWISVGDSLLLLWRAGKLGRLNADHSMRSILAEKVRRHEMPQADLSTHPERNVLLSALLGGNVEQIDAPSKPVDLLPGDVLIAASDGLLSLSGAEIAKLLCTANNKSAHVVARSLLDAVMAKKNDRQDNTTVAVVHI